MKASTNLHEINSSLKTFIVFTLIWILTSGLAIFLRLYPLTHHISDESNEKASMLVINRLRNSIKETVEGNFPQMPVAKKYEFIQHKFDQLLHDNRQDIRRSIHELARKIDKEENKENVFPYLLGSDSFYYYGQTDRLIENGRLSDNIKGSKYLNEFMLAPDGHWEPLNLHPFVGAFIYRLISAFFPDMSLMSCINFTPLILVILTLIPFFIITHHLKTGWTPAFLGGVFLICAPIYLKRSTFGWYDNDPYNLLFGFLILTFLFKGLLNITNRKKMILYAALTGLSIPLYALFWQGWVFIESVLFISGCSIICFSYLFPNSEGHSKNLLYFFGLCLSLSFIGIGLIFGVKEFFILFQEGWIALMGFTNKDISLWPDMYIAVGELRKADWQYITEKSGGY